MEFLIYILYSSTLDRYYVGYTSYSLDERIRRHNSNHKGFTGNANDWKVVYSESYTNKHDAICREQEIKKWKSRKMIELLVKSIPTFQSGWSQVRSSDKSE